MIAYLQGKLTLKTPTHLYVDCQGVGYLVHISLHTFAEVEPLEQARIYTYLHINEQAHTLYGFFTEEEKTAFVALISVNGVGPNTARLVLSSLNTIELRRAIINGEVSLIQKIKGIGPKTAQRMILELKDKFVKMTGQDSHYALTGAPVASGSDEAIAALVMLGFPRPQAEKALSKVKKDHPDKHAVEDLIKLSLKNL